MVHELKKIIDTYKIAAQANQKCALVSVVDLEGSSYRKPGVRMLVQENGHMTGAISGGCVEKEVMRQAQDVFQSGKPRTMVYDGRYRLGCEGVLYVLIEPFAPSSAFLTAFDTCWENRIPFEVDAYYRREMGMHEDSGTYFKFSDQAYHVEANRGEINPNQLLFQQTYTAPFQLLIIGAEHDAVQLSTLGGMAGWQVTVVCMPTDPKSLSNFPGAKEVKAWTPDQVKDIELDGNSAVVLMTHSYAKDLQYLLALKDAKPAYIGILGAKKRFDQLLDEFFQHVPMQDDQWLDKVHGPAGLDIGSITPQEIAISIISEILAFTRNRNHFSLTEKVGSIHQD